MADMKAFITTHLVITVFLIAGCDYFNKSKKLASSGIQQESGHIDELDESAEMAALSPKQQQSTISKGTPCEKLLTALPNEPYFYQFQANLRAYKKNDLAGHLVKSHMNYRNLIDPKTAGSKKRRFYDNCAESILKINRYQDVIVLKKKLESPRSEQLQLPAH